VFTHSEYFPKIIGRSGDVKKRIEKETRTQITIPRKGQAGDLGWFYLICFLFAIIVHCLKSFN
jgi:hypothetical protein